MVWKKTAYSNGFKIKGLKVDGDPDPNTLKAMLNAVDNKLNKLVLKLKIKINLMSAMTNVQGLKQIESRRKSASKVLQTLIMPKHQKDVIKIGNDAIEKARQDDNPAQIAQIWQQVWQIAQPTFTQQKADPF